MTCQHQPAVSVSQVRRFAAQCALCGGGTTDEKAVSLGKKVCQCGHLRWGVNDEGKLIGHKNRSLGCDMWDFSCRECNCLCYAVLLSD